MTHDHDGFGSVTRLAAVRDRLRSLVEAHGRTDRVETDSAVGRVLAASVDASRAVPHFERAAMDGYAIRAEDTHGASDVAPQRLTATTADVTHGRAVRVNTGEPLPDGADAVVKIEDVTVRDEEIDVTTPVPPGANVSPVGEDVPEGRELFAAGRRLDPPAVALLRATGVESVSVRDPPAIGVVPTGEELVTEAPDRGEVVETNGTMVAGLLAQWGGRADQRPIVTDDRERLTTALEETAAENDIVVTTGGSSVGDRDLLADVIEAIGETIVHGVAIKPGHPLGLGTVEGTPVIVLPGYPVSCFVGATQLVRVAVAHAGGFDPAPIHQWTATLDGKVPSEPGVRTFARVVRTDEATVEPLQVAGASVLSSVTDADGWVVVPESVEGYPDGASVSVQRWRWDC